MVRSLADRTFQLRVVLDQRHDLLRRQGALDLLAVEHRRFNLLPRARRLALGPALREGFRALPVATLAKFLKKSLCKGVHCVDLGESFQTHVYLQYFVSIQPRMSPVKFAASL